MRGNNLEEISAFRDAEISPFFSRANYHSLPNELGKRLQCVDFDVEDTDEIRSAIKQAAFDLKCNYRGYVTDDIAELRIVAYRTLKAIVEDLATILRSDEAVSTVLAKQDEEFYWIITAIRFIESQTTTFKKIKSFDPSPGELLDRYKKMRKIITNEDFDFDPVTDIDIEAEREDWKDQLTKVELMIDTVAIGMTDCALYHDH